MGGEKAVARWRQGERLWNLSPFVTGSGSERRRRLSVSGRTSVSYKSNTPNHGFRPDRACAA